MAYVNPRIPREPYEPDQYVGRSIGTLFKWGLVAVAVGIVAAGVVWAALLYWAWAGAHEKAISTVLIVFAASYALWLLLEIRRILVLIAGRLSALDLD